MTIKFIIGRLDVVRMFAAVALLSMAAIAPRHADAALCQKVSEVCVDGPSTRNINGVNVTRDCWRYEAQYQCRTNEMVNDCQPLRDRGCGQIGSTCISRDNDGTCIQYEQKYQCVDKPEWYSEKTVCDTSAFCQNNANGCFDTSYPPDGDFGRAAAMLEAQRQAGIYGVDANSLEIFKGYMEQCSIKVLGGATIKSCCKSAGGGSAFTNHELLKAGAAVATEAGGEAMRAGSMYVYDSLYNAVDSGILKKGINALDSWGRGLGDGVFNPSFNFYGFSFSFSMANGFQFVSFDPYSFAFQIGMMLIQEWLACDTSEQVTSMKRGQNLCVHVETYCSQKVLGVCIERKERHCCFNSKLAKIVNRGGRAQLGMPMNQCGGFNQAQLQSIDFSQLDMSEFIEDVKPKDLNLNKATDKVKQTVDERVKSYYEQ
ncbi:conjugal transfer protein TraN (plasmid) [Burkholderia savannae]|uniref:Conjugal transfer protein TraN n=1 Tax=Burkholderia savannae TaxID=1637837 RepID=A0ABR5T8J8_9BURK|nr:conjugal transfer protein TraN [Burkholderia savannae]AOJ79190.1 conjugal transfer protein TraN [Burkholderia savannae]KWZ39584.1 conjugal transfer protein TraN [Burkholderia savannae]